MPTTPRTFYAGSPALYCLALDYAVALEALADRLTATQQTLIWLDSARRHRATGRYSALAWDPWLSLTHHDGRTTLATSRGTRYVPGDPLKALEHVLARYAGSGAGQLSPRGDNLPPVGLGFLSVFGYELGGWIERLPAPKPSLASTPHLAVYGMRSLVVVDHASSRSWLVSIVDPHDPAGLSRSRPAALERLERLEAWCAEPSGDDFAITMRAPTDAAPQVSSPQPAMRQAEFEAMVRAAQEAIVAGEMYQANLAQAFTQPWPGSGWPLYRRLRAINPSPFACYVQTPQWSLISCSPERLVQAAEGEVSSRPIAGTRPRGATAEEDLVSGLELILSDKERAEHIMLVDLVRNDLGRVCRPSTVAVNELMVLEDYSHVRHIVSNVRGALRPGTGAVDILRAVFPGGTITGCPKVRAMEIIHDLEPIARGFYTGSCGWIGFDGAMDLNILIRTMVLQDGQLSFHVGAGIVADSDPAREYHETLAKGAALTQALQEIRDTAVLTR